METKLTDFSEKELGYMLKGILDQRQTLKFRINAIKENPDLTNLHADFIQGYESEIKSLMKSAAKLSTAIEYVKDKILSN